MSQSSFGKIFGKTPSKRRNFTHYKKSFFLFLWLFILLGIIPVGFFYYGILNARKMVMNRFELGKSQIWNQTTLGYNHLLFDFIPTLSFYQGALDSASFKPIAEQYLASFPFINFIELYNLKVNNSLGSGDLAFKQLNFKILSVFGFSRSLRPTSNHFENNPAKLGSESPEILSDCTEPLLKYSSLISKFDLMQYYHEKELFQYFYRISDQQITYINIPRTEELFVFQDMMMNRLKTLFQAKQNFFVFKLNPSLLPIVNSLPELYQTILVRPLSFDSLSNNVNFHTTAIALPRAFSDYQLYFISGANHITHQVYRYFLPQLFLFLGIYSLIGFSGYLIYRNLAINSKLFKLQYDFINNFSHEFKTPVSVIKITGESIKKEGFLATKEVAIYGRILEEEADKLNNLMNRLLSFTQLENKIVKVITEEILLLDFFNHLREEYLLKYPDFQLSYDLNQIVSIKTDRILLNSVFSNLVENAYKYSYPEKKILKIEVHKNKKSIIFRFIDQGIGIKKEELKHIFNKFYKIENEFNVQGSIGIGLAFCKEVIGLLNGELEVFSKPLAGSEFVVKLPDLP